MLNHPIPRGLGRAAGALCVLAAPAAAQNGPLPFDLDEITAPGHPDAPGIDFVRHPVSVFAAEAGGLATVDVDDDGFVDVFFTDTEGHPNHLYLNDGDGTFTEAAEAFGLAETTRRRGSALFFDMENDGDLDLLSCGYPSQAIPNFDLYSLYMNRGAPNHDFVDVTQSAGGFQLAFLPEPTIIGEPGGAACGDLDGDGFLDLFVTYWNRSSGYFFDQPRLWMSHPNPLQAGGDPQLHASRAFTDETLAAGLAEPIQGWQWTPTLLDVDRDGDLDLHINIDFGLDILRLNDGDGVFGPNIATEVGLNGEPAENRAEMGIAVGDLDLDGLLDTYHTNANANDRLYLNRSTVVGGALGLDFVDVAPTTNTAVTDFGWGTAFADLDNDGDEDLISVAGISSGAVNHYHENRFPQTAVPGGPPVLVERSSELPDFWRPGGQPDVGRNLSVFDADNDGDLDLVVGRYGISGLVDSGVRPGAGMFENVGLPPTNWIQLDARERNGSRNVVGARIFVRAGGRIQLREVRGGGTSFLTQTPYRQHVGLGPLESVDWICVRWFDGTHSVYPPTAANQILRLDRSQQDRTGDVDGDGDVDATDVSLLVIAVRRPGAFDAVYGFWPWQVTGDIDGNGTLDGTDVALLSAMVGG